MYGGLPDATRTSGRFVLYSLLLILTITLTITWFVILIYWNFKHTFLEPANAPNGLTSQWNGRICWVLFPLTVMRALLTISATARAANAGNKWFKLVLIFIVVVSIIAEIAGMVLFSIEQASCNNAPTDDPSGANNLCNDYRWCCVYGSNNVTSICLGDPIEPSCPITLLPCLPPVLATDLNPNWVFEGSFASTFMFLILDVLHLAIGYWMGDGSVANTYSPDGEAYYEGVESSINNDNNSAADILLDELKSGTSKKRKTIIPSSTNNRGPKQRIL
jgi:hypothetical protein